MARNNGALTIAETEAVVAVDATNVINEDLAGRMADAAFERSPSYPGFEAVRELYGSYLNLERKYNDLAGLVDAMRNELADLRAKAVSNA